MRQKTETKDRKQLLLHSFYTNRKKEKTTFRTPTHHHWEHHRFLE